MTPITSIISQALVFIDDVRLSEQFQTSPARFYRKMSAYVELAMPLLNRPPELFEYISGRYVKPLVGSMSWISTEESLTTETVIYTGLTGYDLCSVTLRSNDGLYETPYSGAVYDTETGSLTFPEQDKAGLEYEIDFYKDGSVAKLTVTMMRLFALAVAVVWNERFSNDWLNIQPKVKDSSFDTVNEANYMEKLSIRMKELKQSFSSELHKYEQDVAYKKAVDTVFRTSHKKLI